MVRIKEIRENREGVMGGVEKKELKKGKERIEEVVERKKKGGNRERMLDKKVWEVNWVWKCMGMVMKEGKKEEGESGKKGVGELKEGKKGLEEEMEEGGREVEKVVYRIGNVG